MRTATETIELHFAAADEILDKQLDKLVRQFKKAHPEFVSRYRNARLIVNVAASRAGAPPAPAPALAGEGVMRSRIEEGLWSGGLQSPADPARATANIPAAEDDRFAGCSGL